jgi:hypothetical protein
MIYFWTGGMAQMVEHLPSKYEAEIQYEREVDPTSSLPTMELKLLVELDME